MTVIDNQVIARDLAEKVRKLFPGTMFADGSGFLFEEGQIDFQHGFSLVEVGTGLIIFQARLVFLEPGVMDVIEAYLLRRFSESAEALDQVLNFQAEGSNVIMVTPKDEVKAMKPYIGRSPLSLWQFA